MKENNIPFLKVRKKDGNQFIKILKNNNNKKPIINHRYKVEHKDDFILFPLIENPSQLTEISRKLEKSGIEFKKIRRRGIKNEDYKYKTLEEALENKIPEAAFQYIPQSYDIIGSIAVVEFKSHEEYSEIPFAIKKAISKAITQVNKNVNGVYEKKTKIKGDYRLRELEHLYGDDNTETVYKENSCVFKLDIQHTFFTPRLVYERNRISNFDYKTGEIIGDLFAGVGPFSIQIAKKHKVNIYAFDKNPEAVSYLKKNIALNPLRGTVKAYNLNVRDLSNPDNEIGRKLSSKIDRVLMNLPERSLEFINIACYLLKPSGGIIHNYQFAENAAPLEIALKRLKSSLKNLDWDLNKILSKKVVKPYSPKRDLVVIDAYITER
ncbi:MAG: class I SAM-dependent methyltransferase family protein [Promethearchaeia archaeon]